MAEEEEAAEATEGGEESGGKKKIPLWLIILIPSQVVLIGALVAVFLLLSGKKHEEENVEPTAAEQKVDPNKVKDASALIGPEFGLEPFVANLIDDGRGPRYLRTEIKFELENEEVKPELEGRLAQIRDEILTLLTSKRVTDVETPDGKRILRDEIFTRVNKILVTGRIKRVYFTEFVIQ